MRGLKLELQCSEKLLRGELSVEEARQLFFAHLLDSEDGIVDQVVVNEALLAKVEQPWQHTTVATQPLPTTPTEDALTVAVAMLAKYGGGGKL